jgi:hypothetical protein
LVAFDYLEPLSPFRRCVGWQQDVVPAPMVCSIAGGAAFHTPRRAFTPVTAQERASAAGSSAECAAGV